MINNTNDSTKTPSTSNSGGFLSNDNLNQNKAGGGIVFDNSIDGNKSKLKFKTSKN